MEIVIRAAERAAPGARFSHFVPIGDEDAETQLWRATAVGAGLFSSVILKTTTEVTGVLQTEADALRFLDDIPSLAPRFFGYDRIADLLILEDLGEDDDRHLGEILIGDDRERAILGLQAHMDALALLHRSTAGRLVEYPVHEPPIPRSRHRVHRLLDLLALLPARIEEIGDAVSRGAELEVDRFLAALRDPGPFLALGHGDATPANTFLMPEGQARLFDFETAGYRHALIDGCFPTIRYLHSVWACALPRSLRWELADRYRLALGIAPEEFDFAHASCAAAWLAGLLGFYEAAVENGEMWGMASARARIVAGLAHFSDVATVLGHGSALAETADALRFRLDRDWSSPRMPFYPSIGS